MIAFLAVVRARKAHFKFGATTRIRKSGFWQFGCFVWRRLGLQALEPLAVSRMTEDYKVLQVDGRSTCESLSASGIGGLVASCQAWCKYKCIIMRDRLFGSF